ncbi:MAG: hypothetical protein HFG82_11515 [Dorea sp.]|jgi:transcriptional antiterminator NusG|nr:hypothetical protein [Dorea sp.]
MNFRRVVYSAKGVSVIWYLLHCQEQDEWKTLYICRRNVPETVLTDAFVFTYDRMRRFQGEWHLEKQLMFPACIFLASNDEEKLTEELRKFEGTEELIKECGAILPVKKSVEIFLRSLYGEVHHLSMSRGVIRDGITQVTEGPLRGMEERICRIDRHKRLARLEVPETAALKNILAVSGTVPAGLEIVEKS